MTGIIAQADSENVQPIATLTMMTIYNSTTVAFEIQSTQIS
jgi:hypothetical protein